jgi:hypothetical protein
MPQDILSAGAAWLAGQLKQNASVEARYSRGPDSVVLRAALGSSLLKLDDGEGGTRIERTDADFIVAAADLVLGGATATPERGDRISYADPAGGGTLQFDVLPYADEPVWRYSDPGRTIVRVHAKQAETEGDS